ncbi:MAG: PadR family transcriptional regulator [Mycobacteriaceae bacterium]
MNPAFPDNGRPHRSRRTSRRNTKQVSLIGLDAGALGLDADVYRREFSTSNQYRRGRGRRGDVRAAVLILLAEEPMHGYQLIREITERSHGVWKPSPGSVYPALAQLEDEGLIRIERIEGRKTARLTELGKNYVAKEEAELADPFSEVTEGVGVDVMNLRVAAAALIGATGQVASIGTVGQLAMAAEVLVEARKNIFRILAGDMSESSEPPR